MPNNKKEIIPCICMTCGIRNDYSNQTGYCQNDHDNWIEYADVIEKNQWFHLAVKKSRLSEEEFTKQFMDASVKLIPMQATPLMPEGEDNIVRAQCIALLEFIRKNHWEWSPTHEKWYCPVLPERARESDYLTDSELYEKFLEA